MSLCNHLQPQLVQLCGILGIERMETNSDSARVEIKESVRGKDVYLIQSGAGKVNVSNLRCELLLWVQHIIYASS